MGSGSSSVVQFSSYGRMGRRKRVSPLPHHLLPVAVCALKVIFKTLFSIKKPPLKISNI